MEFSLIKEPFSVWPPTIHTEGGSALCKVSCSKPLVMACVLMLKGAPGGRNEDDAGVRALHQGPDTQMQNMPVSDRTVMLRKVCPDWLGVQCIFTLSRLSSWLPQSTSHAANQTVRAPVLSSRESLTQGPSAGQNRPAICPVLSSLLCSSSHPRRRVRRRRGLPAVYRISKKGEQWESRCLDAAELRSRYCDSRPDSRGQGR